jgi:hypothetical protein
VAARRSDDGGYTPITVEHAVELLAEESADKVRRLWSVRENAGRDYDAGFVAGIEHCIARLEKERKGTSYDEDDEHLQPLARD